MRTEKRKSKAKEAPPPKARASLSDKMAARGYLTPAAVAELVGMTPLTIYRMLGADHPEPFPESAVARIGPRTFVTRAEVYRRWAALLGPDPQGGGGDAPRS